MLSFSPVKKSAFYHRQLAIGAHMVERDGWLQPAFYSSADQESRILTGSIGVCDVSPTGKLILQGDGPGDFPEDALRGDNALAVGDVRQVSSPSPGRLARLTTSECLLLCNPAEIPGWTNVLEEGTDNGAHIVDLTSGLCGVRLTGPGSDQLLSKLSEFDTTPDAFPNLSCAQARFAEINATIVRTDLGPLPSYDLFFTREFGEYVWDAIVEAGEEYGAGAVGLKATDRLTVDPAMPTT